MLRAYAATGIDPAGLDSLGAEFSAAEERLDAQSRKRPLAAALARLTPKEREVLLLHAWGGRSDLEISQALGIRPATARGRLDRARAKMSEQIRALERR